MLFLLPLCILLSQGLFGSAYVVMEENGYYSTWRSNPMNTQSNQWPSYMSPQYYLPFLQNMNPFTWGQPQQTAQQDNRELQLIRDRQLVMFRIMRCLLEEREMDVCRKMLEGSMVLFEEPHQILETGMNKPIVIQSTVWQVKPVEISSTIIPSKPMKVDIPEPQKRPMQVTEESQVPVTRPLIIEVPLPQIEPVTEEPSAEMKPMESELPVEIKPVEVKPSMPETMMPMKPMEEKPPQEKPVEMEIAPMQMQAAEAEPGVVRDELVDVNKPLGNK